MTVAAVDRDRTVIVFLGDSITKEWQDRDPDFFRAGWRNAGINGETTVEMLARFDRDVVAHHPHAVHIMAGTNDMWHGEAGPDAARAIANIEVMVAKARGAGIAVILADPPPISDAIAPDFRTPTLFAPLRAGIAALCADRRLVHVDYASSLADATGRLIAANTTDGVHVSRRGYQAMRRQAEDAVEEAGVEVSRWGAWRRYRRPAIIGGIALLFLGLVAWLVPPTKPIGGARIDAGNQQGFAPITENSTDYKAIAVRTAAQEQADTQDDAPANNEAVSTDADDAPRRADEVVRGDDEPVFDGESDDRGFRIGYRWAERADLEDARNCRALQTSARKDGCRAFIRDAEDGDGGF